MVKLTQINTKKAEPNHVYLNSGPRTIEKCVFGISDMLRDPLETVHREIATSVYGLFPESDVRVIYLDFRFYPVPSGRILRGW